jgi:hypothetical protein
MSFSERALMAKLDLANARIAELEAHLARVPKMSVIAAVKLIEYSVKIDRQNADLQAANNRLLERARRAEDAIKMPQFLSALSFMACWNELPITEQMFWGDLHKQLSGKGNENEAGQSD